MKSYEGTEWKDETAFYWSGEMNEPYIRTRLLYDIYYSSAANSRHSILVSEQKLKGHHIMLTLADVAFTKGESTKIQ